jgi:hypothetical protein
VCAATVEETLRRGLEGVCLVARAQHAALLQAGDGGALDVLAKTFDGPERIEAHEFSLARDALREGVALNVPGSYPWAPPSWLMATRAASVVALPVASSAGIYGCLTIARSYPMSFEGGELARITAFAGVMTAALSARGFETAMTPAGLPGLAEPAELAMATS